MPKKDETKRNPVVYLFGKLWHYSEGKRHNIVIFWIMFICANSISLFCQPLLWAKIINTVQKEGLTEGNAKRLALMLVLTLAIDLAFWTFHGPGRIIEQVNAFWAHVSYRRFLLKGVLTQPLSWHSEHHSGDTIDKVEKGSVALKDFSEDSFETIYTIVQLCISYAMLSYYCHYSSVIVLIMVALTAWITMRFDGLTMDQYDILNHSENQISASVFDAISNITTIIILRTERLIFNAIMEKIVKPFQIFRKTIIVNEIKWFLTSMCCSLMTVVVLIAYGVEKMLSHQTVMIGSVFLLIKYLEKIGELFNRFAAMYAGFLRKKSRIMNSEELSREFNLENFTNHVLPENWKRLDIENLNFSYDKDGERSEIKGASLSFENGKTYALVGESGSGKSTALKLFRDLYPPESLRLSVDGQEIPGGFGGIARAITLVPQSPEIFATTVWENITLGAKHDINHVKKFTDMACFTRVAEKLPHKFDSSIKEKGVNFSGGQQQRLALSRGLLACEDKDIVLLDEPTSNVDSTREKRIYRNILREFEGKTIVSSTHSLHLLPLFDKIYVFDEGRVVGSGTIPELFASCPKFRELWQQAQ